MKQVEITGVRQAGMMDKEIPELREGWALVKIHAAPMCTEYKSFVSGDLNDCLGHEAAGEVMEAAPGSRVRVGDRVVVMPNYPCGECELCENGDFIHCEHYLPYSAATMAQYIAKPSWLLPRIPDGISYEHAALACCGLGASFGAIEKLGVDAFSTVVITGMGPVGLGAVINARFRGARVIAVELNEHRARAAKELGAFAIIDPGEPNAVRQIRDLTGGKGADCGLDCSGAVAAQRLLIDATKRLGKVGFVGESMGETPIRVSTDMLRKGLTLVGSWHYNLKLFPKLMQVIQSSPDIDKLISHVLPMSEIQQALEISAAQQCSKIILQPWA